MTPRLLMMLSLFLCRWDVRGVIIIIITNLIKTIFTKSPVMIINNLIDLLFKIGDTVYSGVPSDLYLGIQGT